MKQEIKYQEEGVSKSRKADGLRELQKARKMGSALDSPYEELFCQTLWHQPSETDFSVTLGFQNFKRINLC